MGRAAPDAPACAVAAEVNAASVSPQWANLPLKAMAARSMPMSLPEYDRSIAKPNSPSSIYIPSLITCSTENVG